MAQSKDFQVGTIVKLKSGGPDMTIKKVDVELRTGKPTGRVDCQWFAGKKLEVGTFPIASLDLVQIEPKGE